MTRWIFVSDLQLETPTPTKSGSGVPASTRKLTTILQTSGDSFIQRSKSRLEQIGRVADRKL